MKFYSAIAQLVEHLTVNQGVNGSSPFCGVYMWPGSQVAKAEDCKSSIPGSSPGRA